MLLFKRLATFVVLVPLLLVLFFLGSVMVGGATMGAISATEKGATDFESGYAAGHQVGADFGKKYGPALLAGSAALAVVAGAGLSFTGIFPWCRRRRSPPPLHRR